MLFHFHTKVEQMKVERHYYPAYPLHKISYKDESLWNSQLYYGLAEIALTR